MDLEKRRYEKKIYLLKNIFFRKQEIYVSVYYSEKKNFILKIILQRLPIIGWLFVNDKGGGYYFWTPSGF